MVYMKYKGHVSLNCKQIPVSKYLKQLEVGIAPVVNILWESVIIECYEETIILIVMW